MRPILLLGREGQLGWELARTLAPLAPILGLAHADLDLAEPDAIRSVVRATRPRLIVNAAAYTQVDKAETEPELAMAINGTAPGILAEEAKRAGAALVHYSTDYVFDGAGDRPWREDDPVAPLNAYGASKLLGEQAVAATGAPHLIFRTAWVYADRGRNFLKTMQRLAVERDELRVVDDQRGSPTWARLIAEATALVLAAAGCGDDGSSALAERGGLYHLTAAGETTWCGFAEAIIAASAPPDRRPARVVGIATRDYPTPAKRPAYSVLDCGRLAQSFGIRLPDWRDGLMLCLGR